MSKFVKNSLAQISQNIFANSFVSEHSKHFFYFDKKNLHFSAAGPPPPPPFFVCKFFFTCSLLSY